MDPISFKTVTVPLANQERKWYVVDAKNQPLGRLCSRIAFILRGKHKPSFSPNMPGGDRVIVINADRVVFSGNKVEDKQYVHYTGYPGGQRFTTPKQLLAKFPERIIEKGVKGMLPKTKLGSKLYGSLYVYAGTEHPHTNHNPEPIDLGKLK